MYESCYVCLPKTKWFWYLDENGLIMNMNINIHDYMLKPEILNSIMLRDLPLIPPDGIIKTYKMLELIQFDLY